MTNKHTLQAITEWFRQAKPQPTVANVASQIAVHYEEVGEMADALSDADLAQAAKRVRRGYSNHPEFHLRHLQTLLTQEEFRKELLDALCDQIVTSIGVAYMCGFDIEGALDEVNRANWSKFEDGKPLLNEHGKIIKGPSYTPPDLTKFI